MLLLTSTSDIVRVVTGAAVSTITVHVSYVDNASGTITPGRTNTNISTATTTTICSSPGASTQRNVRQISITNNNAVVYWDASKDSATADDCKRKGSDAFSSFCTQNASLSFSESSNLINRFEWKSSKPRFGEATVLAGSFGTPKCGSVR